MRGGRAALRMRPDYLVHSLLLSSPTNPPESFPLMYVRHCQQLGLQETDLKIRLYDTCCIERTDMKRGGLIVTFSFSLTPLLLFFWIINSHQAEAGGRKKKALLFSCVCSAASLGVKLTASLVLLHTLHFSVNAAIPALMCSVRTKIYFF